jgi:hypothetical protein
MVKITPEITVMLGDTTMEEVQTWLQALQIYFTASRGKVKFEKYKVFFLLFPISVTQLQFQTYTSSTLFAPKMVLKRPVKIFYDYLWSSNTKKGRINNSIALPIVCAPEEV